jgi:putative membrane protein
MDPVAVVLAVLEGLLLIGIGVLEAFGSGTSVFRRTFGVRQEHLPVLRVWLVNQGFYNIVFGLGFLVGVIVALTTDPGAGRLLIVVLAAGQAVLGIVLLVTEPRLWRGAAVQTLLSLAVAIATLVGGGAR